MTKTNLSSCCQAPVNYRDKDDMTIYCTSCGKPCEVEKNKFKMVLAGNREQFERYLAENGLTDSEARYVFQPQSVYGYGHDYEIVKYGTYYEHRHYYELLDLLIINQKS